MPFIEINTFINAPIEKCFDLARSIDLHLDSMAKTKEKAIAGRTSGLIELGETVTWRAKHFWIWQNLTSKITAFNFPNSFTDEMITGVFKSFKHQHLFSPKNGGTLMVDIFEFESPLGIFGKLANILFLNNYMRKLLKSRNKLIKEIAEQSN
jgi:ligand-binding SRPBCC domain-containing protein